MKFLFTNRNRTVNVSNERQLVEWMRKRDPQYTQTNFDFMEMYAQRKKTFDGFNIDYASEISFVRDLLSNNIIVDLSAKKSNTFSFLFKKNGKVTNEGL